MSDITGSELTLFREMHCKNCGSQRCDGSEEWLDGCELYEKYIKNDNNHKKN